MSTLRDLQMLQLPFVNTGGPMGPRLPNLLSILTKGFKATWITAKAITGRALKLVAKVATRFKNHLDEGAEAHNRMMALQDERYQRNWYHIRLL